MSEIAKAKLARRAVLAAVLLALRPPRAGAQDILPMPRVRPPPKHETIPPSPGRSYEWSPGAWKWSGSRFVWVRGRYKVRRPWTYRWVKGHFEGSGGTEKWVRGFYGQPTRRNPYLG
jgi:hypothetical protein